MIRIAGVPLVTLFDLTDQVNEALPPLFQAFAERFTVSGLQSRTAPGAIIHSGKLQSLSASVGNEIDEIDLGFGRLTIPGVTGGLPFQLSMERTAITGNLEPSANRFQLDLLLDDLGLAIDVLEGARFQKEAGTVPRRLVRIRPAKEVKITGSATVRFEKTAAGQPVQVKLIDRPDPFDPRSVSGGVARLNFTPPHFYFGTSEIGMTVTTLTFDFSEDYSPPVVLERNQSASWMGLVVSEATVYLPPAGAGGSNLSIGIRNFLLGSPLGLQGEVEVQFGRSGIDAAALLFRQDNAATDALIGSATASGGPRSRTVAITAAQDESVGMTAALGAVAPPEGGVVEDWKAEWRWPDGSKKEADRSHGTVRHGQVLRVTPIEEVAGQPRIEHPELSFRFVAAGVAPTVDVTVGGTTRSNVTKIEGPATEIAALTLTAQSTAPGASRFIWTIAAKNIEHEGATFQPNLSGTSGDVAIKLREIPSTGAERVAHVLARADDSKPLMIGGEDGVVLGSAPATVLVPAEVVETYDLSEFHAAAALRAISEQATLDAAATAQVSVPDDGLANVRFEIGGTTGVDEHDRHLRVFLTYDSDRVEGWQPSFANLTPAMRAEFRKPALAIGTGGEATVHRDLIAWAANYPEARLFLVVGRCDDIGPDSDNDKLADKRADKVVSLLTTAAPGSSAPPVAASRVLSWPERSGKPATLVLTPQETATSGLTNEGDAPIRLIHNDPQFNQPATWPTNRDANGTSEQTRVLYRRVDVHAIGGTPTAGAVTRTVASAVPPEERRSLVPASGSDPVPAEARSPQTSYRIKILIGWDKPNSPWTDLVPNLAEFEYAWSPDDPALPPLGGQPVDVTQEVLTIYGKWIHDDLTGFTRMVLGIKSEGDPRGLFWNETPTLVAAAGFGPMLLSGVDFETDTIGSAARIGALAGVMVVSNIRFGDDADPLIAPGSEFAVVGVEASAETRSLSDPGGAYKLSLTLDYTVKMHIDGGVLGFKTNPDNPVKFRYNKVGVEFDSTGADFWDQIGFVYNTDALTVEDPGRWQIDGPLGKLLRIVEVALGTGSFWIEARIALALTIGVVEISEATFRVTFDAAGNPSLSLRGLVAKVKIPSTLEGEGRLKIEPDGTIKAGVDVKVIPLKMSASAAFAMKNETSPEPFTFVSLYVKVIFPVGIPLGTTGMAIHGFIGQTAINGERAVTPVTASTDVVSRELGWWRKRPEDKYRAKKDQHALGLGVVLGTLPDASFSFSVTGMVVVAFPDPEVILGVEVVLLSTPQRTPTDAKTGNTAGITGLVVIDDQAVTVAVSASYEIPKLLKLVVPFGAYFPYSGVGTYVRIGSDGQAGRSGEPVTITILPDTLDLQAWAYLMIEADGLPSLGGRPEFSFEGFSIGFGAGMGLDWSAGPIKLNASASILVGFGTDPLFVKGGLFVSGELDLVVVSIAARGDITLTYKPDDVFLDGQFCGEVDLFFFSLKGCVKFKVGNEPVEAVVEPPAPVVSVSLTDRLFRVMGEAAPAGTNLLGQPIFRLEEQPDGTVLNTGAAPKDNHTVWADTAPVLNFRHAVDVASTASAQFDLEGQPSGEVWFGSNRLKYAYRLRGVRLIDTATGALVADAPGEKLQAAWMTSPTRQPDASGTSGPLPSGEEKQSLKLLDWDPFGWAVPMADGGAGSAGDPGTTVEDLCEPLPEPTRACVHGEDAVEIGPHAVRMRQNPVATGAYPSRFVLSGVPGLRTATSEVSGLAFLSTLAAGGITTYPGYIAALPQTVSIGGASVSDAYRLPAGRGTGAARQSLPWLGRLDRTVRRGRLSLMVCDSLPPGNGGEPGSGGGKTCFDFKTLKAGDFTRLATDAFVLASLDATRPIVVTDRISLLPSAGAQPGSDGVPDIAITLPGAEMKLRQPCRSLEITFYRPGRGAVVFEYTDATGQTRKAEADGATSSLLVATLEAPADITSVVVHLNAKAIHIVRLCCNGSGKGACESFRGLPRDFNGKSGFEHSGFKFETLSPNRTLGVGDSVDERGPSPVPGQDGEMEIRFPDDGMRIVLPRPCSDLSLHIMLFSGAAEARGIAADGRGVAAGKTDGRQRVEQVIRLRSAVPMTEVLLRGGGSESWLYRICCNEKPEVGSTCFDFARAALKERTSSFRHEGATFFDLRDEPNLHPRDDVARKADGTPVAGSDGIPEMGFAAHGFGVSLSEPAAQVILRFLVHGSGPVIAEAKDGLGALVAKGETPAREPGFHEIVLAATGIRSLAVVGGDGKAVLYQVCVKPQGRDDGQLPEPSAGDGGVRLPFVVTLDAAGRPQPWTPTIVSRGIEAGRRCLLVEFAQPASLPDVDRFQIVATQNVEVSIIGLCALDSRSTIRREQDQAARAALLVTIIGVTALPITEQRPVLLLPDRRYRIEVDWSWQAWQTTGDGTGGVPSTPPPSGAWNDVAAPQVFEFLTAAEDLAAADTGDGLNEYKFDPADIVRYLNIVDPADGRSFVFTRDPLWAHFSTRHIEDLLAAHDRKIGFEVRRTDPPPQVDDASRGEVKAPLTGIYHWLAGPQVLEEAFVKHMIEGQLAAPCLPDVPAWGGGSLAGTFLLEPNAMYDFNLIAPRTNDSDPRLVSATRFVTSRYASPVEMLAALGFPTTGSSPFRPGDLLMPEGSSLPPAPTGGATVSDAALGAALAAIGADTLPLPGDQPRTTVIWSQDAGGLWGVGGVLLDAPEPLRRETAIAQGGSAVIGIRCAPEAVEIGGVTLAPAVATLNWTRVLFSAATPVTPPAAGGAIVLRLATSDGPLSGSRHLPAVPAMIEDEGF